MLKQSKLSEILLNTNFTKKVNKRQNKQFDYLNHLLHKSEKTHGKTKTSLSNIKTPSNKEINISFKKMKPLQINENSRLKNKSKELKHIMKTVLSKSKTKEKKSNESKSKQNKSINYKPEISRSNSISNLDQTTTICSSNSKRKTPQITINPISNIKLKNFQINPQKKNYLNYNQQILHTQADDLKIKENSLYSSYNDCIVKTKENMPFARKFKLKLTNLTKSKVCIQKLKQKIQDNYLKTKKIADELISEDSLFDYSKTNSITVTNNNSKEKNICNENYKNESELQTISLTYSEDEEGSVEKSKNKKQKIQKKRNNCNYNKDLLKDKDFITFCEEMNQKLFS